MVLYVTGNLSGISTLALLSSLLLTPPGCSMQFLEQLEELVDFRSRELRS